MRYLYLLCFSILTYLGGAQTLTGAWEMVETDDSGRSTHMLVIFSENGFQSASWFNHETGAFIATNGGQWKLEGQTVTEVIEFDTRDSTRVGSEISFDIELTNDELKIKGMNSVLTRVDDGTPGDLAGAWLISSIMRDGTMREMDMNRPRKTMKILSGTKFQWIAYNTETKRFMGTGGGSYTTEDGKYTEHIEFFSRDDSRVGASLEFDYDLKEGHWHHSGKSSKGNPLSEVWSPRNN